MSSLKLAVGRRALVLALLLGLAGSSGLLASPRALAAAAAPGSAPPAGGLPRPEALRAKMEKLRAELDAQSTRLEILAEDLDEADSGGATLLTAAAAIDQRRQAAAAALYAARADQGSDGWRRLAAAKTRLDRLDAMLLTKVLEQARRAERMQRERLEAARIAATLQRELASMDRQLAALLASEQQRQEAARRAAFTRFMDRARAEGRLAASGPASPIARRAVRVALAQLGVPYVYGAAGPDSFDCSGLTSFAYRAAGLTIPRTAAWQFAAYAADRFVTPTQLRAGDLVFYATDPADPSTIHHVGLYLGNGLMVEAPHTGAVVRVASIWRPDYAGAVRPAP